MRRQRRRCKQALDEARQAFDYKKWLFRHCDVMCAFAQLLEIYYKEAQEAGTCLPSATHLNLPPTATV